MTTTTLKRMVLDMSDEFLHCRTDGHSWQQRHTERDRYDPALVIRLLSCERCLADRTDVVNVKTGLIARRKYVSPKGYRIEGFGRQSSSVFRLPLIARELMAS
jgi:hypothetical protein